VIVASALFLCTGAVWAGVLASGWAAQAARETIVTGLSRSLGRPVALGGVSGNLLNGIELRDLVIAERGGFSHGVAFSVDHIRLSISLWDLARRPQNILAAISRVDLTTPHIELSRDARGVWNVADMFTQRQSAVGPALRLNVTVHGGVVGYADSLGVEAPPFLTRFEHIDGTIATAAGGRVLIALGGRSTDGETATVHGRYAMDDGTYDLDITTKDASVARWGGYLVRLGALRWDGGRFSGRIHLLATASRSGAAVDYTAAIRLDDAEALYRPAGLPLRHARGELQLTAGRVAADGLTLVADNSPVWVRGDVSYAGPPWLDIVVRGERLDLARVRALLSIGTGATLAGRASGDVWISGPLSAPSVSGTVRAADGRFNRQDFTDLTTRFDYDAGVLSLRKLSAGVGAGHVAGDAVIDLAAPEAYYAFAATAENVDTAVMPRAGLPAAGGVTGRGSGTVAGVGAGSRLQMLGAVSLGAGAARGQSFDQMTALFWDDGDSVLLDSVRVKAGKGTVYASGSVSPDGALDLSAEGHDVPLAELAVRTGVPASVLAGVGRFDGHVGGTLADPALAGAVAVWDGRLGPLPYTYASGTLRVSPESLSTARADFFDGGAHYGVTGSLALRPMAARGVAIEADGVSAQSFLHETAGIDSVTGTLAGRLVVDGPVDRPSVAGYATLTRGTVLGQTVDAADVELTGGAPGVIQVARLDARASGSRIHASGTVDARGPLDLNLQADRIRPGDISALSRFGVVVPYGTVTVDGRVTGTASDPEFYGRLISPDLWMRGQAFSASGIVDYRSGLVQLAPLDFVQRDASYSLSGSVSWTGRPTADLNLHVTHGQVATLVDAAGLRLPAKIEGVMDGDVALSGPLSDPSARLTLALNNARVGGVPAGTGEADLVLSHGAIDIRQFDLHPGRGEMAARGQVRVGGTSAVELSARDLDPAILVPIFHLRQPLVGTLNFTMQWTGPATDPTAGLSFEATGVGVPGVTVDRITALAYYKSGTVTIQNGMIVKDVHSLALEGTLPVVPGRFELDPNGPLQLSLHLEDADLSFLSLLTPAIQDASGTVAGGVTIGGTVASPTMSGSIRTAGGGMRYAPLRTPIEDIAADIAFSQDEVNVRNVSADVGGGRIAIQGTAAISDFKPQTVDFGLTAKQLLLDIPGLYTGRADAALALRGPAADPTLSGGVTLSNGRITYTGALPGGAEPAAPRELPPIALDVNVGTNGNLSYGEGPVQLALTGKVHAGGTLADPKLSGEIRSENGTVSLFGTLFTIVEGRATFSETLGLTPMVTARAQGEVGDYRIFVDVSGLPPNPSVVWSSEPPLTQTDIFALVFGTTGQAGTPTGLAGVELGRLLISPVTSAIQRALHLDELSLSYDTQNPLALRIGKFITAKFYLTLTEVFPQPTGTSTGVSGGPPAGTTAFAVPVLGLFNRPAPSAENYTIFGINYLVSPNVSVSYNVDTFGDTGYFVQTRFPF
jgi:translocation and assembly module TamB